MTTTPRVLHYRNRREYPDAVYIGRPSKWGNPFVIGKDGTRDEVIERFRYWFYSNEHLLEAAKVELRGRSLICFCAPAPCHGDVLLEFASGVEGAPSER